MLLLYHVRDVTCISNVHRHSDAWNTLNEVQAPGEREHFVSKCN